MQMLPLTQAQAAIWYAQQKTGDGRPYQIGGSVRIQGEIDFALLRAALEDLVRENEGLRQQFCVRNGRASGYFVSPEQTAQMGWKDFLQSGDPRREFEAWAHTQLNSPFLLIDSPLYAFTIFRITRQETGYFIKLHHLIADGWSVELITKRVARAYEERLRGDRRTRHFPSYADYVAAEQSLLCSDQLERQTGFWVDRLSPPPEIAALDGDVVGQASRTTLYPAVARMDALRHAADEWGVSINAVWIALVCLYQYKKHGQTDVVLGLPLLGRAGRIEREMIGTFTNTMPLRLRINRSVSVRELIETVDRELGECYRRQKAPYSQLLARLQAAYHGVERLYDICVNCYNTVPAESIGGLPAVNTEYPRGAQEYSLQMILRSWNGGIFQIDYDYRLDCVSREGVDRMHCQLMLLLDQVVASPEQPVEKLGLLSSEEFQHMVYDWNQTVSPFPKKETVLDRIVREAERFPERAAILFADQSWCYRQLLFQVRRYAAWLWRQGARPGMVIGLAAEHTPQCLAGALAILWCGCIYQPLDPSDPPSRIGELLAASGAAYMVTYRRQRLHHLSTIALEDAPDALQETESPRARPSEAAYCITTSGSTGRPKGVMVSHRSIMNYLWWARGRYLTAERESFVLYSSFAFDFTMTSFLLPLLCGQEVRLYPGQREDNVFQRIFRQGEVTVLKITPSHIPLLLDALPAPPSLHTLILGGENLPGHQCAALADALGGRVRIWNEYGPTEATVGCMIHQYEKKDARRDYVPLGRPIANTRVYLLDEDGMPVPGDRVGEIVVGGEGVAMGYRHNPDETDRCFISDPFAEGKAYRTGDLARWQSDGVMIMVGRRDEEIKIRGHRVCLAEIERCIVSSGLADNARVVVRQVGGERLLCAYLTGSDGTGQIREYCVLHLPDYLVPQWFCVVERLPITRRGKLDLEGLPLPDPANRKSSDAQPLSEDIKLLIRVMQTVLEGEIGAQDNFYALGGDSIKAIQIASRLNEQGFSLKVGDILRNPVSFPDGPVYALVRCAGAAGGGGGRGFDYAVRPMVFGSATSTAWTVQSVDAAAAAAAADRVADWAGAGRAGKAS